MLRQSPMTGLLFGGAKICKALYAMTTDAWECRVIKGNL
jgi:hypothetical protein